MIKFLTFLALVSSAIAVALSEGNGIHIDRSPLIQAINLYAERNAFPRLKAAEAEVERWYDMVQLGNGGAYFKRASGVSIALYAIGGLL